MRGHRSAPDQGQSMGFNPHHKYKRKPIDVWLIAFAVLIAVAGAVWAFSGSGL